MFNGEGNDYVGAQTVVSRCVPEGVAKGGEGEQRVARGSEGFRRVAREKD